MALDAQTVLSRNRLFQGLSAHTLKQIAILSIRRPYRAGLTVFSQGDPGDAFYGVVTGKVRISVSSPEGKEMFLNLMEPGDSFGEIALLDGQQRTATACTTAPSELLLLRRDDFLKLLTREPQLVSHLLQLLCQRIRWTSGIAEEYALLKVPARLARRLLSLGALGKADASGKLQLTISQEELARFLGLSRQVINQYLQHWKAQGWVDLGRSKITLLDENALREVVSGNDGYYEGSPAS